MGKRKKFSTEEKLRAVLTVLAGDVGIAELARRSGCSQTAIFK